jgi:DNA polymerase III delta subunit
LQQLNRLSLDQLGWVLSELGRIDFGMKTGQTSAPIAIERLVLKLFSMQKSA